MSCVCVCECLCVRMYGGLLLLKIESFKRLLSTLFRKTNTLNVSNNEALLYMCEIWDEIPNTSHAWKLKDSWNYLNISCQIDVNNNETAHEGTNETAFFLKINFIVDFLLLLAFSSIAFQYDSKKKKTKKRQILKIFRCLFFCSLRLSRCHQFIKCLQKLGFPYAVVYTEVFSVQWVE